MGERQTFSDIMASLGIPPDDPCPGPAPRLEPLPADSLFLSVQGGKALSRRCPSPPLPALPGPTTRHDKDGQGNQVHISSTADNLASGEGVAWETPLPRTRR